MADDEEDSMSDDFSPSEEEWTPKKHQKGGESSDDDDSDFEEVYDSSASKRGKDSKKTQLKDRSVSAGTNRQSAGIHKRRKPSGQSLRTKLYNKYRPPPKTLTPANSPSASTSAGAASKNANAPNDSNDNDSSSDGSVDDYLINPNDIDYQCEFFNVSTTTQKPAPPVFDCNAGMKRLSDSETAEDDAEEEQEQEQNSNAFDFRQLLQKANSLDCAKNAFEKRTNDTMQVKRTNETAMDVNMLLALGEKQKNQPATTTTKHKASHIKKQLSLKDEDDEEDEDEEHSQTPARLSKTKSTRQKRHTKTRPASAVIATGADTDDSDWEEVADANTQQPNSTTVGGGNLEIHLELPSKHRRRDKEQKTKQDLINAFRRRINRELKERQLLLHKTSLLCFFARNLSNNRLLNDTQLMQAALKLLPSINVYPNERGTASKYFQSMTTWYKTAVKLQTASLYVNLAESKKLLSRKCIKQTLLQQIERKEAICREHFVFIMVILLRGMGMQCRLVVNMQPLPLKPPASDLLSIKLKKDDEDKVDMKAAGKDSSSELQTSKENAKEKRAPKTNLGNKKTMPKGSKQTKAVENENVESEQVKCNETLNETSVCEGFEQFKINNAIEQLQLNIDIASEAQSVAEKTTATQEATTSNSGKRKQQPVTAQAKRGAKRSAKAMNDAIVPTITIQAATPTKTQPMNVSQVDVNQKVATSESTRSKEQIPTNANTTKAEQDQQADDEAATTLAVVKRNNKRTRVAAASKQSAGKSKATSSKDSKSNTRLRLSSTIFENKQKPKETTPEPKPTTSKDETEVLKVISNLPGKEKKVTISTNFLHAKRKLRSRTKSNERMPQLDGADDAIPSLRKTRAAKSKKKSTAELQQSGIDESTPRAAKTQTKAAVAALAETDEDEPIAVKKLRANKSQKKSNEVTATTATKTNKKSAACAEAESDEDFQPSPPKKIKTAPVLPKAVQQLRKDRRVLSTDDDNAGDESKQRQRNPNAADVWLEVWSDVEQKWICIDLVKGKVDAVDAIRRAASNSFAYIYAFQNDLSLKDVTARYNPNWATVHKERVEKNWLEQAIVAYQGQHTMRDMLENQELRRLHEEKPMPTAIGQFKDHPLYVLERHLLKFQAIYPPDAPSLGFIRGEPIYARDCVHVLHSRDIWLKQARVVKPKQEPYKIVKARPKWDRQTQTVIKDQPLEIFGYWQTQDYEPPTAENGIVPRNAYGNVELFKECMLPKKTVHIKLPGLQRVCKKLNIDCANAVIGFDFHQGACHPLYDGFVVCEEFEDQVVAAWHQDQEEQERKEQQKYEDRVYGNWKKLIKGLLIRERLQRKYNFKS